MCNNGNNKGFQTQVLDAVMYSYNTRELTALLLCKKEIIVLKQTSFIATLQITAKHEV